MIEHNKLVRDRIPEIIRATGKTPVTRTVADVEERKRRLIDKLIEEVQEYKDTGKVEELADLLEVLQALVEHVHDLKWEDVRELQGRKWEERGGFDAGIVLERVEG